MGKRKIRERLAAAFLSVSILANQAGFGTIEIFAEELPSIQEDQGGAFIQETEDAYVIETVPSVKEVPAAEDAPETEEPRDAQEDGMNTPEMGTGPPEITLENQEETDLGEQELVIDTVDSKDTVLQTEASQEVETIPTDPICETEPETESRTETGITAEELRKSLSAEEENLSLEIEKADGSLFAEDASLSLYGSWQIAERNASFGNEDQVLEQFLSCAGDAYLKETGKDLYHDGTVPYEDLFLDMVPWEAEIREKGSLQSEGKMKYHLTIKDPVFLEETKDPFCETVVFVYQDGWKTSMLTQDQAEVSIQEASGSTVISFSSRPAAYFSIGVIREIPLQNEPEETEAAETETEELETEITVLLAQEKTFLYEDDKVTVNACVSTDALFHTGSGTVRGDAEGLILHAEKLQEGSVEYQEAMQMAEASVNLSEGETLFFLPYDVYFEYGGEKVEPEDGQVRIQMEFRSKDGEQIKEGNEQDDLFVIHIKDDGAIEHLGNDSSEENSVEFQVSSFSIMGPAMVTYALENETELDAYAILYESGELVFQRGDTPDESKGAVTATYTGFETSTNEYHPWSNYITSITSVTFKDKIHPVNTLLWFRGATNLTSVDAVNLDMSNVTAAGAMFYKCSSLTEITGSWNLSNVEDFGSVFVDCNKLASIDTSQWGLENVTTMFEAFRNCSSLQAIDTSGWNLANVLKMDQTFEGCTSLKEVNGNNWGLQNVTTIKDIFKNCTSLATLGTSGWTLENCENALGAFYNCKLLEAINTTNWVLNNLKDATSFFENCSKLKAVDGTNWGLNNVTNMTKAFQNCKALTDVKSGNWYMPKVTDLSFVFAGCSSLVELDGTNWDLGSADTLEDLCSRCSKLSKVSCSDWNLTNVKRMKGTFYGCEVLKSIDTASWSLPVLNSAEGIFQNCYALTSIDCSNWGMSSVTTTKVMFEKCYALKTVRSKNWDLNKNTTTYQMFNECRSLVNLDTSTWGLSSCTNMEKMFYNCAVLSDIDTSGWVLPKVTTLNNMFWNCATLTYLDASKWGLNACTKAENAFRGCTNLECIDTTGWNLGKLTRGTSMFYDCTSLSSLGKENWCIASLDNAENMFYNCRSLASIDGSSWNTSKVKNMKSMFSNCISLETLDTSGWNLGNLLYANYFMNNCQSMKEIDGTNFNFGSLTTAESMFKSCNSLENIIGEENWRMPNVTKTNAMLEGCQELTELSCKDWGFTSVLTNAQYMFKENNKLKVIDMSSWDMTNVSSTYQMFYNCTGMAKFVAGEKFRIQSNAALPYNSWIRVSDQQVYPVSELYTAFNACDPAMEGVYTQAVVFQFYGNGGTPSLRTMDGYFDMTPDELPEASKTGAYFTGWYTEPNGGVQLQAGDPLSVEEYYAHWDSYQYTLTLKSSNDNGDELVIPLAYDTCYQLSDKLFTNGDLVLAGWNTRKDGSGTSYAANEEVLQLSDEDGGQAVLYAQWIDITEYATVTFDTQGGSAVNSRYVKANTAVGDLPQSKRDGYLFDSWRIGAPDGPEATKDTVITEDTVLYATWNKNPLVTFDGCGVVNNTTKTVRYGSKIGKLPSYTSNQNRPQILIGWFTDPDGGEQITSSSIITGDTTLYAHWGWQPQFNAGGGSIISSISFPVQDSPSYLITSLPEAERDGYRFDGWYLADGTQVHDGDIIDLSAGSEIRALWKPENVVTIDFDPNGGTLNGKTGITSLDVYMDKAILSIYVPKRNGYEFCGWADRDGNLYTEESTFSDDIELFAVWKEKNCTVTFVPGEDATMYQSMQTQYVPYGETLNTIPGARKPGYVLEGWYTQENGQGEKLDKDTIFSSDITYYAYYVPTMTTESDESFLYSYGVEWSNASNTNVDNVDGNLEFHPTNSEQQTASLHVRFELNRSIGDSVLPTEAVKIRIPKHIWKDWDGNNTGSNNVSALLPVFPDIRSGMYFSYYEEEDSYVLVNNQPLVGGAGVDITVSYNVDPWNVPGGATDMNGRYVDGYDYYAGTVPVSMSLDADLDGTPETQVNDSLSVEMHTKDDASAKKESQYTSFSWDDKWGERPDDADKYFYVTWRMADMWSSTISQPFTYEWSEDTVHDGSVVAWSRNGSTWGTDPVSGSFLEEKPTFGNWNYLYVVTRHPMSLLENVPVDGITLYNEAVLLEHWESGYTTSQRVNASIIVYGLNGSDGGIGEFDKIKPGYYGGHNLKIVEGGQETIVDENDVVDMAWDIHYNGNNRTSPVTWDADTETYEAKERTIRIRDGVAGDLVYSSGLSNRKYKWEPALGNIDLSDEDYYFYQVDVSLTEKDVRKEEDTWTDAYVHKDISDYDSIDVYVRYKNTDEFVFYKELYVSAYDTWKTCTLPEDVVGFEIRHNTSFYSTLLYARGHMKLKPTQKITTLIQNDISCNTTSLFKNRCTCEIWNTEDDETAAYYHAANGTDGENYAYKELFELNVSETYQYTRKFSSGKDNVIFDVERGTQDNPVYIKAWNYNTSGRKKRMTSGELYDLLPSGTTVDVNTVFGIPVTANSEGSSNLADAYETYDASSLKLEAGMYDVTFVDNWENSNRTMMVIRFTIPSDMSAVGIQFWYKLHNTYENILQNGTTVENDVAFINTTKGAVVPAMKSYDSSIVSESEWYASLKSANEDFISFAEATTNYVPVDAFSWGFDKSVQTVTDYEYSGETIPNNEYTYRLTYSQSDFAKAKNIVFYDILEYGADRTVDGNTQFMESAWHGVLKNVNVRSISEKLTYGSTTIHCAPVVYYSTKERSSFTSADLDVSNTDVWTSTCPDDLSTVTAVAVDCSKNEDGSDFLIMNRQVVEVYITMVAPSDLTLVGEKAYNEAVVYTQKNIDEFLTPEYSDSDITLTNTDPQIHKSSNPVSGTAAKPEIVQEDEALDYTITVTNNDAGFTLHDVVVEDTVPDGLIIDKANISVQFGGGTSIKVEDSPRVSLTKTGQKLVFTVSSLLSSETMVLHIPTIVSINDGVLVNTAAITSVNGIAKSIGSETTYHEAKPVGLLIEKEDRKGNHLEGATLQLIDKDDNVVEEWVSGAGTHYMVVPPGDYTLHEVSAPSGYLLAEDIQVTVGKLGNISVNGKPVTTVVMVDEKEGYDLTVHKTVTGNMGNKAKDFRFQLHLAKTGGTIPDHVDYEKDGVSGSLPVTGGVVEFTLAHEGSIRFIKLPTGVEYTVVEPDAQSEGYTVAATNDTGVLTDDVTVTFINQKNMSIPTGGNHNTKAVVLLLWIAIAGIMGLFAAKKKNEKGTGN